MDSYPSINVHKEETGWSIEFTGVVVIGISNDQAESEGEAVSLAKRIFDERPEIVVPSALD